MKVIIIGAGPAGMTAAYQLTKKGVQVEVFESSAVPGGMAASFNLWNQRVDYGPHRFFSNDPRVNKIWLEAVDGQYEMVSRLTRIFYKKKFFYYPLRAFNSFWNLGPIEASRCLLSYLCERMFFKGKRDESGFEGWVVSRFGRRLYEIFFKTYSEKLWGIPCDQLDADFAAQRIKNFSLGAALKSLIFPDRKKEHKTLVDEFAYPLAGAGSVYENMAGYVMNNGGRIHFGRPVHKLVCNGRTAVGVLCADREEFRADHVISSMPLTHLVRGIEEVPDIVRKACNRLTYRNTVIVYLRLGSEDLFPDNWLYVHEPSLKTGRITNSRNWLPSLYGNDKSTIVAMEYWCYPDDEIWDMDEKDLVATAVHELKKTGLDKSADIMDGCVRKIEFSYPVYKRGYKNDVAAVRDFLDEITGLSVIGRYGAFKYNNQDHSILMGILAAENICDQTGHDLWSINTDYKYQESAVIIGTGLVDS
ncbi:MAG: FAD-dependent oxidoreductase [Kiritimatiellia bacterium]